MSDIVPSYILKMRRAKHHLECLTKLIGDYQSSNPYEVRQRMERKHKTSFIDIIRQPDDEISLVAADLVHNVHCALDHIACALVPSNRRDSVSFPILWQGVWDAPRYCESVQRLSDRNKWQTITRKMKPEAVAVLKGLQPHDATGEDGTKINQLVSIHRLWNTDKHQCLPIVSGGLLAERVTWDMPDGSRWEDNERVRGQTLDDRAGFVPPKGAMNVNIEGTAVVAIRPSEMKADVAIPEHFIRAIDYVERLVINPLVPYLHAPGTPKPARAMSTKNPRPSV